MLRPSKKTRSDNGLCWCDKQTEHPWPAGQKAPSVTVTWGWGSDVLRLIWETTSITGRKEAQFSL